MHMNRKIFVPYLTAGFPNRKKFVEYLRILTEFGDFIEIGIPFSDPLADGTDLQIAHEIGVKEKVDIDFIFETIRKINTDKSFIIMSYLNPILSYGFEKFLKNCKERNIIAVVIPDMPLEEVKDFLPLFRNHRVHFVPLATPSTSEERFFKIEKIATFFIYFVSVKGTTGPREIFPHYTEEKIRKFRSLTKKRLFLGFGVKGIKSIEGIVNYIDGVIMGSEIARRILKGDNLRNFLKKFNDFLKRRSMNG